MGTPQKHLIIIAGEASGDMRAAGLVAALKEADGSLTFSGVGGDFMRAQGVDVFEDITSLAVIGIVEVIKNLNRIKRVFHFILKEVDQRKPAAVILVDYPGFNLRLAKELKAKGIKVIYYISPQVWAWREKRVAKIKHIVDRMIVLFPFEEDVYRKYGMSVDYVGHPLIDEVKAQRSKSEILKSLNLNAYGTTIGIMPGSRTKEIERHLPIMLEAAELLYQKDNTRQFILLKASTISKSMLEEYLKNHSQLPVQIFEGKTYDGINAMDAAMVASGTATLETALLQKPLVVVYKTSWITYAIAKAVIKIPYISLVNIVAGQKVVDEFIQNNATAKIIAQGIESALTNPTLSDSLMTIRKKLGQPNASQRAADVILDELKK